MNARSQGGHPPFFHNADVICIDPADIFIPERIGFLHEDKAVALGRLMAVDGQRDPIKVAPHKGKQSWKLVTGRHRLRGAEIEGIHVYALEVGGDASDHADLEASENLHRRPLGPIERAKFTAALVQAAQERIAREHGDVSQYQLAVKARWDRVKHHEETVEGALRDETEDTCAKFAHVYGWEESVGEALGMSRRTIHNDLSLYRLLIEPFPDLVEALSKHPVVGENASQLKKVAAVKDEAKRRAVIEALLADAEIGADDARISAGVDLPEGPAATPVAHQKFYNQIVGGWDRLGNPQRTQFLPQFAALLTDGQKRDLRDILDRELGE
jgi:ParB-like chromosome segregation protein Spo0J